MDTEVTEQHDELSLHYTLTMESEEDVNIDQDHDLEKENIEEKKEDMMKMEMKRIPN